jgi:predicted MPP superfamily phosphohydrolase
LSHRPENFASYVNHKIDLTLAGHAHGGQAILPFVGGLIAPNQGFFPKYYKGIYTDQECKMIV